ncbi:MAG: hypothetical protein RRB13_16190 [bacterium]|nr:hypothetical protein [bacterium]
MGQVKHAMEQQQIRDELSSFVSDLLEGGYLEGAAAGIAKQVVDRGLESLSEKQRDVFEAQVIAKYGNQYCKKCNSKLELYEIYEAMTEDGLCGSCAHREAQDRKYDR